MFERIVSADGKHFGTVKFQGLIPAWNEPALGIEWDDPTRGKNNGNVGEIKFFTTKVPGSGSFIKESSKKIDRRKYTFVDRLKNKYAGKYIEQSFSFGTKSTETYGFEKLTEIQSNFKNLEVVSLNRERVSSSGDMKEISHELTGLKILDLSYNLISNWDDIWEIIQHLHLESLDLSGNRFSNLHKCLIDFEYFSLKQLNLTNTLISGQELEWVLSRFPNLEIISLAHNHYTNPMNLTLPTTVNTIDLSFNSFTSVPEFANSVKSVNLANNCIEDFKLPQSQNISTLDIRSNNINSWNSIAQLYTWDLKALRIDGNPLFEKMSIEEQTVQLIARLNCGPNNLTNLNGAILTKAEISNAEMYFVSKVKQRDYEVNFNHESWIRLAQKYNVSAEDLQEGELKPQLMRRIITLKVHLNGENSEFKRDFLITNSVLAVKGILAKKYQVSALQIELSYNINKENDQEKIIRKLDDNFALLDSFDLQNDQLLYVNINGSII